MFVFYRRIVFKIANIKTKKKKKLSYLSCDFEGATGQSLFIIYSEMYNFINTTV